VGVSLPPVNIGAAAPFLLTTRKLESSSEARFSKMLHWFREETRGEFDLSKPEHKYLLLLAAAVSHQGYSLITAILTGSTSSSAMLARGILETSKRFVDTLQNGIAPLLQALKDEREQLAKLQKIQVNDVVHTVDPTPHISELDQVSAALNPEKIAANEKTFTELFGSEAEEYWKLLSLDVHGRPSMLHRQYSDLVKNRRIDFVCVRDADNTDAHLNIAAFALYKMAMAYFDSPLVVDDIRAPLKEKLEKLYALSSYEPV
jgi:hypothetical protein